MNYCGLWRKDTPHVDTDIQEFSIRPELYLFVRASESIMGHDSLLSNDERDVLLTYVQTLSDRYLALAENPTRLRDS